MVSFDIFLKKVDQRGIKGSIGRIGSTIIVPCTFKGGFQKIFGDGGSGDGANGRSGFLRSNVGMKIEILSVSTVVYLRVIPEAEKGVPLCRRKVVSIAHAYGLDELIPTQIGF